ncbi:MAG: hypothetical protein M3Z15_13410 [Pseudomonadota bacterium]|nr:hypothetical protein [Pseudomonadota bacterium]
MKRGDATIASSPSLAGPDARRAGDHWAPPSARARVVAMALAVAFAATTFAVVNRVWRRAAPPPPALPTSVAVKLVPTPLSAPAPLVPPR